MITFLVTNNGYNVYVDGVYKGYTIGWEEKFKVYKFLADGGVAFLGIMDMYEARTMFEMLYL